MVKVLALTKEGNVTWCTAPEDKRGQGRCNHIAHQKPGQSIDEFMESISETMSVDDSTIEDQTQYILNLVSQYGRTENPDWENVIKSLPNPFVIGSEKEGTYEEAEMVGFKQVDNKNGSYQLTATYLFRGEEYECDYGEVPIVNEDGTIDINGVKWRVLPVVEQNKAGLISYYNNIVAKQKDGRNISFIMSRDEESDTVKIYGKEVPIELVEKYFKTGETDGLTSGQIYALKDIDPIVFERFPNFGQDLRSMKNLPIDEAGDLEWRRCKKYDDIVQEQYRLQLRRMGVTFRSNLAKKQEAIENGMSPEEANERYPLFYQTNLTENIKSDLVGRSNVQHADNLNPIAALSQSQKISYTGPGGYHKDKVPYELRLPHDSHEFLIDPNDTSTGKNVGLTGTLSMGRINEKGFIERKERGTLSPSDFIPYKLHNDPNRAQMAVAHMKQACPLIGGEDPIVKTPAWETISGAKLGVNLRIAYIPSGNVYEDAVVISESAAAKMATIQRQTYKSNNPNLDYTKMGLKVGQRVERKDQFGDTHIKVGGNITKINKDGFEVETVYQMTPGDKLAGRHGNKSVVSKVLPDSEMPKIINPKTGEEEPAQVIMSPLSVVGRKNLGQIMETNEAYGNGNDINHKNKVILNNGQAIEATAGIQYIHRLNHISEKKLSSHADELTAKREAEGARLGEMESILLSTDEDRLKILRYLRHQEAYDSHKKLNHLMKAIGVDLKGVNWDK